MGLFPIILARLVEQAAICDPTDIRGLAEACLTGPLIELWPEPLIGSWSIFKNPCPMVLFKLCVTVRVPSSIKPSHTNRSVVALEGLPPPRPRSFEIECHHFHHYTIRAEL